MQRAGQDSANQRRFDAGLLDAIRQRVTLSTIIGRTVRSLKKVGKAEWVGLCPIHQENTGSFTVNDDKGFAHCFGCGAHFDVIDWTMHVHGLSFVEAVKMLEQDAGLVGQNAELRAKDDARRRQREADEEKEAANKAKWARGLWMHAMPGPDTPAEAYLRGRGIDFRKLGRFPRAIRYRGDVPHGLLPGKPKLPAMLLPFITLAGEQVAVHRTFLAHGPNGWAKITHGKAKLMLGEKKGAHIPLWKGEFAGPLAKMPPRTPVYVSEGIEDGLSIAMLDPTKRVVAAGTLENIGALELPPQAGDLIIVAQHDGEGKGQNGPAFEKVIAAQQVRAQTDGSNRRVQAIWPKPDYKDFNDQIRGVRCNG